MRNRSGEGRENPRISRAFGPYHYPPANDLGCSPPKDFFGQHEVQFDGSIWLGKFLSPEQHAGAANVLGSALPPLVFATQPITQVDMYSKTVSTVLGTQFFLPSAISICFHRFLMDLPW